MEKVASNFNFDGIERILLALDVDHSSSALNNLKREVNKFFYKSKCEHILYTVNTDKLFFGMRVYPHIEPCKAKDIMLDDHHEDKIFSQYSLEFDSKLFDPMLNLDSRELTAILLHEIGHIVYDTGTIDAVKNQIDMYYAVADDYADKNFISKFSILIAYGLKDSIMKMGSLFSKLGYDEVIADSFVISCGYGPELESAMNKILRSSNYMNRDVDDRLLTLSWILRLRTEFNVRRFPAIKTLNKAKTLTASQLEKRDIADAERALNSIHIEEAGIIDNMKERFSKRINAFKTNGIRGIKNDVFELNLRLRAAETEEDLLYVIRSANTSIAILQDYLTDDISDAERQSAVEALQTLYDIRQNAAKNKSIRRTDSLIQVVYPTLN